jgi:ABC-type multidrug transport system fused ATPase/permease subunit
MNQLVSFLGAMRSLLADLFRFRPWLLIKILFLSGVGSSLQGFALASTFFILRGLEKGMYIEVGKGLPVAVGAVNIHIALLMAGVFIILGFSVILIYFAEKTAFYLSKSYANSCGASLIERFPLVAQQFDNSAVHPKSGLPVGLVKEIKLPTLRLEIAVRRLIQSPTSFFQVFYGSVFLLYLEPKLTLVLVIVVTPILWPLNRLTRTIKDSERKRMETSQYLKADSEKLAFESGRLPVAPSQAGRRFQDMFKSTGFAASNYHRYRRLVAKVGSQELATAALTVTGTVSLLYFWVFYGEQGMPVALIIAFFGALRLAVMGGRQVVARMAAFARFYEKVQEFFGYRSKVAQQEKLQRIPKVAGITGSNLTKETEEKVTVKGNGPFAAVGTFPLLPINRYAVTGIFPGLNRRRKGALVLHMMVIHENPDMDLELTWRELLGFDKSDAKRKAKEKLKAACHALDAEEILIRWDVPLSRGLKNGEWSSSEAIEAILLRSYFLESPVVVAREEALERLGIGAAKHWKKVLADRLLFVYYQYEGQELGRWGEQYVALIRSNAGKAGGIAPVEWANANPELVLKALKVEEEHKEESLDELELDDDFDDE